MEGTHRLHNHGRKEILVIGNEFRIESGTCRLEQHFVQLRRICKRNGEFLDFFHGHAPGHSNVRGQNLRVHAVFDKGL